MHHFALLSGIKPLYDLAVNLLDDLDKELSDYIIRCNVVYRLGLGLGLRDVFFQERMALS